MVFDWLQSCAGGHESCRHSLSNHPLPTRLIDVGNLYEDPPPHLCLGSEVSGDRRYMALSHRWGDNPALLLRTANLVPFFNTIPWDKIPKTFQHAMKVVRAAGLRYIWIDSLCIVQDSIQDWARESTTMHQVYKHSFCTISAIGASNDQGGCFFERTSPLERDVVASTALFNSLHESPLFSRGWVFQERVLSPRILHFGRKHIFWECDTRTANPHRLWKRLAIQYSTMKFTKPEDRLAAIAGIAQEMVVKFPGLSSSYFAGMWIDLFFLQLLWYRKEDSILDCPSDVRPTWSWTSINALIQFLEVGPCDQKESDESGYIFRN
ncbi:heterokaryon incompatibility protein-domain-containing protein [Bisporella sp. PMI_857]|nr:heterokaryon incompatibility protein-domain-containing protein [Bisporella sp. PMI_857]